MFFLSKVGLLRPAFRPLSNFNMGNVASYSILEPSFLTGLIFGISASYFFTKRKKVPIENDVLSKYHEENYEVRI